MSEILLVYEPGSSGHRPVYREYIRKAVEHAGLATIVVRLRMSPAKLVSEAINQGANHVVVCTIDGEIRWFVELALRGWCQGLRVYGVYYLFNNLYEGWRAWAWKPILAISSIGTIFVMDPFLDRRSIGLLRRKIKYLPDTYDPEQFRLVERGVARRHLKLPVEASLFLTFGELSRRKGIDVLIETIETWNYQTYPQAIFLFAGRIAEELRARIYSLVERSPWHRTAVKVHDRRISEEDVAVYYSSANYYVAPYPKWFKVSSGTVTRALAAGVPVITANHGVNGEIVCAEQCGLVFEAGQPASLSRALERALDCSGASWREMSRRSSLLGAKGVLSEFKAKFSEALPRGSALHYIV